MTKEFDVQLFKQIMKIKDDFAVKRHSEKFSLVKIRFDLSKKLIEIRDNVAGKRHQERLELLYKKARGS